MYRYKLGLIHPAETPYVRLVIWIRKKLGLPIYPWTGDGDKDLAYINYKYEHQFYILFNMKEIFYPWYFIKSPNAAEGVMHHRCKFKPRFKVDGSHSDGMITPFYNIDDVKIPKCIWCKEKIPNLVAAKVKLRGF